MKRFISKLRLKHLLFILGLVILIFFLKSLDFIAIYQGLSSLTLFSILLILLLTFLSISLRAYRWQFLASKASEKKVSYLFSLKSIIGGVAAASLMPARIEVSKPLLLKMDYGVPISRSFPLILFERLFDLFSIILFLVFGLFFVHLDGATGQAQIKLLLILLTLLSTGILLSPVSILMVLQRLLKKIPLSLSIKNKMLWGCQQIISSLTAFNEKSFTLIAALSVTAVALEIVRLFYILHFFKVGVSFMAVGFVFSTSVLIGVLSAIPGGIGIVEFSAANILSSLDPGSYPPVIKSAILLDRIVAYYLLVGMGSFLLIFWKKKDIKS